MSKKKVRVKRAKAKAAKKAKKKAAKTGAKGRPKLVGKISSLGIFGTWVKALTENARSHLSDEKILSKMKKEFPDRAKTSKVFSNVATHRRLYNTGFLTEGKVPKVKSVKYA